MRAYAFLRSRVAGRLDIWRPSKWRLSLSVSTESFLLILCLVKRSVTATRWTNSRISFLENIGEFET